MRLDPLDTAQQPDVGLVMVIDRSGSMQEPSGRGGRSKLDLAKEAVYQASLGLSLRDQLGLVVFDSSASWVLQLQQLPPAIDIERALSSFGTGGGTDIRPGVELAAQSLTAANAKVKHVILLTDGIADSNYSDLIKQMHDAGITISTVAIGGDANPNLEQIASEGGGRFYRVQLVEEVPQIFLQETVIVAGRDIVEGQFTPQIALPAAVVRGLGGLPPLQGYNGTEIKETARTILVTPDGKPVLAQWQYGLGRAVAWTSDFKGQWARDWVGWAEFPRFIGGLADLLLPPQNNDQLTLQATNTGVQSALELSAQDQQGRPLNDLTLEGRLVSPESEGAPLQFAQVGPGRYRAIAQTAAPGVYLAQVSAAAGGQPLGLATTGLVVSYSPEYSVRPEDPQLLGALAELTGGRNNPPAEAAFDPTAQAVGTVSEIGLPLLWLALLLLPLDIGLRRLPMRLAELLPRLPRRARPAASSQAETLARLEHGQAAGGYQNRGRRVRERRAESGARESRRQRSGGIDNRWPMMVTATEAKGDRSRSSKLSRRPTTDDRRQTADNRQRIVPPRPRNLRPPMTSSMRGYWRPSSARAAAASNSLLRCVSCLLSPVSCLLSPVSCLLSDLPHPNAIGHRLPLDRRPKRCTMVAW